MRHVAHLVDLDGVEWTLERSGVPRMQFTVTEIDEDGQTRDTVYQLHTDRKYHAMRTPEGGQRAGSHSSGERKSDRRAPV